MDLLLADGCSLHYQVAGRGAPVVLIHGTAARVWGASVDALARDHRVIEYDRRSYGQSGHAPLRNTTLHARDAAEVIERVAGCPSMVVGWSAGGVIALELASTRPELVSALVLLEPPFGAARKSPPRQLAGVIGAMLLGKLGLHRQGAAIFLRSVMRERDGTQAYDRLSHHTTRAVLANAAAITTELFAGTGEHLSAEQLRAITIPTELLIGARSADMFQQCADRLSNLVPTLRVTTIDGAGHFLQLDAPEALVEAVARLGCRTTSM